MTARPLRILAFCDWYAPGTGGGAERVAHEVYRRLCGREHDVLVVTQRHAGAPWQDERPPRYALPAVDLRRATGLQVSATLGAARRLDSLVRTFRPDVLHAHSLQFSTTVLAARLARRQHLPLVVTAHIAGFEHLPEPWRTIAGLHDRLVGGFVLRRAHTVTAVSDAVAAHLADHRPPVPPIVVIPNGVDLARFASDAGRPDDATRLVLIGRLVANKGADVAIQALPIIAHHIPGIHLDVLGDGPLRSHLEARASSMRVRDRVRFHGHVDDVAAHLQQGGVLIRPSLTEGMPLAVLEAMAAGLPVIASSVPGNRTLIEDGTTGILVPPADHEALAHAVIRLAGDEVLRQRLTDAGRRLAETHTWDDTAAGIEAVLRDAAEARTHVPHG